MNHSAPDFNCETLFLLLLTREHKNHKPGTQETEGRKNTHINGFIIEVFDVLRAHIQGGFAGHQEH
jgi:hypothetical protein